WLASTLDQPHWLDVAEQVKTDLFGALQAALQEGLTRDEASREHLEAQGIVKAKQWLAIIDADTPPDHPHADGQAVPVRGDFVVGGEHAAYPGDQRLSPGQRIHCRFTVPSSWR